MESSDLPVLIETETLGYVDKMRSGVEKRNLGRQGELEAEQYLVAQGYELIMRNYRCSVGELDLVVQDQDVLVFVEVRTQSGPLFGDPLESVTLRKQKQVIKAAAHYTARYQVMNHPMRFDVIGISWTSSGPQIIHVKGAFELPSSWW